MLVDFTRDYDAIKQAIAKVEHYDRTSFTNMMQGVRNILLASWGSQNYSQVLVFTDCGIGLGQTSIRQTIAALRLNSQQQTAVEAAPNAGDPKAANTMCLPFAFASKLSFICIGQPDDAYFRAATPLYQELLDVSGQNGELFVGKANVNRLPKTATNHESGDSLMRDIIARMCETNYKPFEAVLKCGGYAKLECSISLWPKPTV